MNGHRNYNGVSFSLALSLSEEEETLSLSLRALGGNGRRKGRSPLLGYRDTLYSTVSQLTSDAKVKRVNNYGLVLRSLAPGPAQNLVLSSCPLRIVLDGTIH